MKLKDTRPENFRPSAVPPRSRFVSRSEPVRACLLILGALLFVSPSLQAKPSGSQMQEAICNGDLNQVKSLIAKGFGVSDPLDPDQGANSIYPLTLASYCYGGKPEIAAYLISRGADVNKHSRNSYSNLMWALRSVRKEDDAMHKVAWDMIRKGANANWIDSTTGRTPLMGAAGNGDLKMVQELIRRGASKTPRTKGDWCISDSDVKCNAADHARMGGHVEVAY